MKKGILLLALLALLALFGATWLIPLQSRFFANMGLAQLLKALDCPVDWFVCRTQPFYLRAPRSAAQQAHLDTAGRWLTAALRRQPASLGLLHQATLAFVQGDRLAAARALAMTPAHPAGRSPLVSENRYEFYLTRARQHMEAQRWQDAVEDFRRAMVLDPYGDLPTDDRDWYRALAGLEIEKATADGTDNRARYLAGKYLAQAGEMAQARQWLEAAGAGGEAVGLSSTEVAWANVYLARVWREEGNLAKARAVLEGTLTRSPDFRPAAMELLEIARELGDVEAAQRVETILLALGPTNRLGQQGAGYQYGTPAQLPSGWTLVGYELDEQLLEQTTALDLVLWWQGPAELHAGHELVSVGEYVLLQQRVHNLFANAGFEWDVDSRGIPVGHDREYYGGPPDSMEVTEARLDGALTNVLAAHNTALNDRVALLSFPVAVDESGQYLMATWLRDEDGLGKIGRLCIEQRFGPETGYYIMPAGSRPTGTWNHLADLALASPGQSPVSCAVLVLNSNSQRTALWDKVLFAQVETP